MILMWCSNRQAEKLNDKFRRRFGPNSSFTQHPGTYKYKHTQGLAVTMLIVSTLMGSSHLCLRPDHFEGVEIAICYAALQGLYAIFVSLVAPGSYLLADPKLRMAIMSYLRDLRN